jgi:hypothetical protein
VADTCVKCGLAVQQPSTGRRRRYCSTGCRRAREYELKRLQRRLESLEDSVAFWRREVDRAERRRRVAGAGPVKDAKAEVARFAGQVTEAEARLRDLLDADE